MPISSSSETSARLGQFPGIVKSRNLPVCISRAVSNAQNSSYFLLTNVASCYCYGMVFDIQIFENEHRAHFSSMACTVLQI